MEFERALLLINAAVCDYDGKPLKDVETNLLKGVWQGQTYEEIAEICGYSAEYLRCDAGNKLWKRLSQAFREPLSKKSFRSFIERRGKIDKEELKARKKEKKAINNQNCLDLGEAIDVGLFYGRNEELETLQKYILQERCRLVAIVGMGGIGKTALAVKLAKQLVEKKEGEFDYIIWRSLRNAPILETLLRDLVSFLSDQQDTHPTIERLVYWLECSRSLVILDNWETILQSGERAGHYRCGYESYGELLEVVGESSHQSCLILTSREKPAEIATLEGDRLLVRSLQLSGSLLTALAVIEAKGLVGTNEQKRELCDRYGCSPLALKIVAGSIQEVFNGEIAPFVAEETLVFNGVRRLLEQQFDRLSQLERSIMYWLAINREWTSIKELAADLVPPVAKTKLLEALESLSWRFLIEKKAGCYTQQPVVMEYLTERLTEEISRELIDAQILTFDRYALVKTSVLDYLRQSQIRLILGVIAERLQAVFSDRRVLENQIGKIVQLLRDRAKAGYGAGNLINLSSYLEIDLSGYDFSYLSIWQADLQNVNLHRVNFSYCDFKEFRFTHPFGSITSVAFSPDGEKLATGEGSGEIRIWRIADEQPLIVPFASTSWILSIQFSPDGKFLAAGYTDCSIRLWDVETGNLERSFSGHSGSIWSVKFSPDGKILASGSADRLIKLWDVQSGQLLETLQAHTNQVQSVDFSPKGNLLASVGSDRAIKLWDLASRKVLQSWEDPTSVALSVRFSPDGNTLATGNTDRQVKLWDVQTGQLLQEFAGHQQWVWSVRFSRDGKILGSGSGDGTAKLWDVRTGQPLKTLPGHSSEIWSIGFSPDGNTLATGSNDHTVKLWHVQTGELLKTLQGYSSWVTCVRFNADATLLASSSNDRAVRLWDWQQGKLWRTLAKASDSITSVDFSADGKILAAGVSGEGKIELWDTRTGKLLQTLLGHSGPIQSVAFEPHGERLASGSFDRTIKLWDTKIGQLLQTLEGHTYWIFCVDFSPNSKFLASASHDRSVKLWNANTGDLVQTFKSNTGVWSVKFSPDSKILVSGNNDGSINLWSVETGQILQTLLGHTGSVASVVFSPDGELIASASHDRTVKLWNAKEGKLLRSLQKHEHRVLSVIFSPDGMLLASGSADRTIRFWQIDTGRCSQTLRPTLPYENTNITGVKGLTEATIFALKSLGAIEFYKVGWAKSCPPY